MLKFREFLEKQGISPRVAGDHVCRCRRLERDFKIDLSVETADPIRFAKLLQKIKDSYQSPKTPRGAANATSYQLGVSARKYALFKHGKNKIKKNLDSYYIQPGHAKLG